MQGMRLNEDDTRQCQKGQKFSRETSLLLVVLGRPRGLYYTAGAVALLCCCSMVAVYIPHNGLVHWIKLPKMTQLFFFRKNCESQICKYNLRVSLILLDGSYTYNQFRNYKSGITVKISKVQLISEWLFDVLNSPKNQRKNLMNFCHRI